MLKNYLKITWKVLMRNKLFTFISLFGISLTLTILIVGASFYDYFTKSNYPAYKQDRIFYTSRLHSWKKPPGEKDNSFSKSFSSYYFLDKCFNILKTPESVSIFNIIPREQTIFINSKKIELKIRYCDDNYWNILDFNYTSGRPFNKIENDNSERVAVLGLSLATDIFGDDKAAIGRTISVDDNKYKVVGVVKDAPISSVSALGNLYLPITTAKDNIFDKKLHGIYQTMILAKNNSDLSAINSEFQNSLKKFEKLEMPLDNRTYIKMEVLNSLDRFLSLSPLDSSVFFAILYALILIIILIPSLNLINLNANRINERLTEIGIRKSFGARRISLIGQFLIENIALTLIGGFMALIFSYIILKVVQLEGIIPSEGFLLNYRILFTGLMFCFLFGFIAGVLPAYRMSRMQIVESLKHGES
jgi:putative ABC transport system permease protein